ncbi:MAG: PAS domain S-box protein [Proteobacteria bacterium]|nr:PAS domain S-box protein [Pseudomonadota bacterium]
MEKEYLVNAIDAFKRSIIIISTDFKILAANHTESPNEAQVKVGDLCYQALYSRSTPCTNCLALEVIKTRKAALRPGREGIMALEKVSCLYSYPIFSGEEIHSLVIMDFAMSTLERMEERIHRSNGFLSNLIKSAVDGIIAADMTGKILIFNDAACEISGYDVDEVINIMSIREIYPGDGARNVMRMLRCNEYGDKGTLRSYRVDIKRKTGEIIPISLNAAIVYDGESEVATLGFFHDLRDTLKIEAELEKTQVQLLQAEKMSSLGKLAAGVAHQLNNPLGGITLFSQLIMEDYELPEGARKDLERILHDAQRCSNIVKELLEFSRQTSNEMRPQDINHALSQTLFLLENQTIFHDIVIEKDFNPSLPLVPIDKQQINHVFMNIILNAADAMEGRGTLSLSTSFLPEKNRVCIKISDTGPGIPENILPKIFDPFFTTKEQGKGTGLGLSLVYGIIEDHGGHIRAESTVGIGTKFIIELLLDPPSGGGTKSG